MLDKIRCDVVSCAHNKERACYANCVDIVGTSARDAQATNCGSFLNKAHYSQLTGNTLSSGSCDCLQCAVETCKYHDNHLCTLNGIQVSGGAVDYYTHTQCSSFACQD